MAMVYLSNPYIWGSALPWLVVFGASFYYIKRATALSQFIDNRCPEIWPNLSWLRGDYMAYRPNLRAGRIDRLILLNSAAKDHPNDPEFGRLLSRARWSAGIFLLAFVAAIALLGKAGAT
jgi:hypothetical protein